MENKDKLELQTDERKFIKVYKDFLKCQFLNTGEKMVFIALKYFADFTKDADSVYPGIDKICNITGMTRPSVTKYINTLVAKNIVKKKRVGLSKNNVYTLTDYGYMWIAESEEQMKERAELSQTELKLLESKELLEKHGYIVTDIKKAPVTDQETSAEISNKADKKTCVKYSLDFIRNQVEYSIIEKDMSEQMQTIDVILDIMLDTLNNSSKQINVGKELKQAEQVKANLLKISRMELIYALNKYNEQTERIKNPKAYMLTLLYNARNQMYLDFLNVGHTNGHF